MRTQAKLKLGYYPLALAEASGDDGLDLLPATTRFDLTSDVHAAGMGTVAVAPARDGDAEALAAAATAVEESVS